MDILHLFSGFNQFELLGKLGLFGNDIRIIWSEESVQGQQTGTNTELLPNTSTLGVYIGTQDAHHWSDKKLAYPGNFFNNELET